MMHARRIAETFPSLLPIPGAIRLLLRAGSASIVIAGCSMAFIPSGCTSNTGGVREADSNRAGEATGGGRRTDSDQADYFNPSFEVSPRAKLEQLALRQQGSAVVPPNVPDLADQTRRTKLIPTGMPPERLEIDLAAAISALKSAQSVTTTQPIAEKVLTAQNSLELSRVYSAGRERLTAGDALGALPLLEAAAKLDPGSVEILTVLAEAQLGAGRRSAALATYERAIARGLTDATVLAFVGREQLRNRRYAEAAPLLEASLNSSSLPELAKAVAAADLSDALLQLGYVRASAQLLSATLVKLPDAATAGTLTLQEAELYRRRPELWQRAGDLLLAANLPAQAEQAFAKAAEFPGADSQALARRRVESLIDRGQTAQAALLLFDAPGGVDVKLLSRLLGDESIAPSILEFGWERAISQSQADAHRTVLASFEAARATNQSRVASPMLGWFLYRFPDSPDAFPALIESYGTDQADKLTDVVSRLCWNRPELGLAFANDLVDQYGELETLFQWCQKRSTNQPRAWMLGHYITIAAGRTPTDESINNAPRGTPPEMAAVVRTMVFASQGRWIEAEKAAAVTTEPRPRALALAYLQRYDEALATAPRPTVDGQSTSASNPQQNLGLASLSPMVLAAWAMERGDWPAAEKLFLAAKRDSPADERSYAALFQLYAPKAPLSDESKISQLAKDLRLASPESRFARSIAARDALARGRFQPAADIIFPLNRAGLATADSLALLVALCERSLESEPSITDDALALLESSQKGYPLHLAFLLSRARLMVLQKNHTAAASLLEVAYNQTPRRELARLRENIVREGLQDPATADELQRMRLTSAPRDADLTLEYARFLIARSDFVAATDVLSAGLPSSLPLTREQSQRLGGLVPEIKPELLLSSGPETADRALALFDAILARGVVLPLQTRLSRVMLVCAGHSSDSKRIYDAVNDVIVSSPDLSLRLRARVIEVLLSKPDPSDALAFLGEVVNRSPTPDETFAFEWFRLTFIRGDVEDFTRFVETVVDPLAMLRAISSSGDADVHEATDASGARAELAYWLGNAASSIQREPLGEAAYRMALKLHPGHAWALNNLGYNILESGEGFVEAAAMIEQAYAMLSEEPSVIDSLGWLRYKQGRFLDAAPIAAAEGDVIDVAALARARANSLGAVSLLELAVNHENGSGNPEQRLHFGDALWRAGQSTIAPLQWENGRREAETQLSLLRSARAAARDFDPKAPPTSQEKRLMGYVTELKRRLEQSKASGVAPVASTQSEAATLGASHMMVDGAGKPLGPAPKLIVP